MRELKDRTATIELEAHQRARAIESQAEEKAKKGPYGGGTDPV